MRFSVIIVFFSLFQEIGFSQDSMPAKPVVCHFSEENSFTQILPENFNASNTRLAATANIEVSYVNFPAQAKSAFEQAVLLWEKYLISSQTIRIEATWEQLTSTTLAVSGATQINRNFRQFNNNSPGFWFTSAERTLGDMSEFTLPEG